MGVLSRGRLLVLGGFAAAWMAAWPASNGVAFTAESELKAAFVYRFATFVSWPSEAFRTSADGFVACVLGDERLGRDLKGALEGKEIGGRPARVRSFGVPGDLSGCHLLYVDGSFGGRSADVLAAVRDRSVLTVGEPSEFLEQGGVIQLVTEGSKLRFEVSRDAAQRAGLQISSRLLQLAANVR